METSEARQYKRITDHVISGFNCAHDAIIFGNTAEKIIKEKIGQVKFKLSIGTQKTVLAITSEFNGETVLKMVFLEIKSQNDAQFIVDKVKKLTQLNIETYHTKLLIEQQLIRGKPQPQTIGFIL
jgi:hypothetical protein